MEKIALDNKFQFVEKTIRIANDARSNEYNTLM